MAAVPEAAGNAPPLEPVNRSVRTHRWRRALPWLVLAAGVAFSGGLLGLTRPGVFYSGDGGVKLLLVQQFARGELRSDLRIPAEPWAEDLWRGGLFPFEQPFTWPAGDRVYAWCSLPFPLLTAPFYAALGWRGLYAWPAIGLLGTWLVLGWTCRRLDLGPVWTALALFALVFCSPLTIYGAIYWEHTLAVALATAGLALLAAPAPGPAARNGFLAGLVLGLSAWLRLELAWLAAVAVAVLPFAGRLGVELRGRRAFLAGVAAAGAGLLAWNAAAYGRPLGMAGVALGAEGGLASRLHGIAWLVPALVSSLARHGPVIGIALLGAISVLALPAPDERARGQVRLWTLLGCAFVLGVPLVLPSGHGGDGGKQFGPRYLLPVFPMAALVLAISARSLWARLRVPGRAAIAAALAVGLGAGTRANALAGARDLASDYAWRVAPVLERARADPARTVAVTNQFMSMELASLMESKRFFLVRAPPDLLRLAAALPRAGERRFLFVGDPPPLAWETRLVDRGEPIALRVHPIGCFGSLPWCLHEASVTSSLPP